MPYNDITFNMLANSLSEPRMLKYLVSANQDEARAVELYIYNSHLARAFLFPLEIAEVVTRNAIDRVLVRHYGERWHRNTEFLDNELNPQSRENLQKAFSRARSGHRNDVIAALTFDYWSNLFRGEYWGFWGNKTYEIFPNFEKGDNFERDIEKIGQLIRDVNRFRNRVAHHEPIFYMDCNLYYKKMIDLTGIIYPETAEWMRGQSTVPIVMRSRPR